MEPHEPSKFTTTGEYIGGPRFVGAAVTTVNEKAGTWGSVEAVRASADARTATFKLRLSPPGGLLPHSRPHFHKRALLAFLLTQRLDHCLLFLGSLGTSFQFLKQIKFRIGFFPVTHPLIHQGQPIVRCRQSRIEPNSFFQGLYALR